VTEVSSPEPLPSYVNDELYPRLVIASDCRSAVVPNDTVGENGEDNAWFSK
jgi:hypothetical protein